MDRFTQSLVASTAAIAVVSVVVLGSIAVASNYQGSLQFDLKSDGLGLTVNQFEVGDGKMDD